MLSFTDSLKRIIADVQATGGAVVEHSAAPSDLLQRLTEHAVQRASEAKMGRYIMLEWFTEGFFGEYVRACVIHLHKLGVVDNELAYRVIANVIDAILSSEHRRWERGGEKNFEEQLAFSLSEIWDQAGDDMKPEIALKSSFRLLTIEMPGK